MNRPSNVLVRSALALALAATSCGPSIGSTGDSTTEDPPSTSSTTSAASTSAMAESITSTTSPDLDDGVTTAPVALDLPEPGTSTGPDPEPPHACTLPTRSNALVTGVGPFGEVHMEAAIFAETGGGKCAEGYRIVLAANVDALDEMVAAWVTHGPWPAGSLVIDLDFPDGSPAPGTWEAFATLVTDEGAAAANGVAEISSVTGIDDPSPMLEGSIAFDDWMLEGTFGAPYCWAVHGTACGA